MNGTEPVRRLWFVRHGETEGQSSIRFHGRNDVALNEHGRAQIRALAPLLAHAPFVRVVHSPLRRAAESAAILAALCGATQVPHHADERLREISFGACEGMTEAEIEGAFPGFLAEHRAGPAHAVVAVVPVVLQAVAQQEAARRAVVEVDAENVGAVRDVEAEAR